MNKPFSHLSLFKIHVGKLMKCISLMSFLLGLSCGLFLTENVTAQTKHFNLDQGLAIYGYDPVAYFLDSKAKEGSSEYSFKYQDVEYRFINEKHKTLFSNNPGKYLPQYGGWCAYAMGDSGEKVEIDPETFKIVQGKLYLFYNFYFNNTLKKWNKEETLLKKQADKNWQELIDN